MNISVHEGEEVEEADSFVYVLVRFLLGSLLVCSKAIGLLGVSNLFPLTVSSRR